MAEALSVLMVDDNPADGDTVKRYLEDDAVPRDVEFKQVLSAEEALATLEDRQFDLLLVDYHFPFGNGFDILRKIRGEGVESPAVMLTGQGDEEVASQAVAENLTAYLSKAKLSPETLEETLRTALGEPGTVPGPSGRKSRAQSPQSPDGGSNRPGPGRLLSRLSDRLGQPEPGGVLLAGFRPPVDEASFGSALTRLVESLDQWLGETNTELTFHRIRETTLAGLLEPSQVENILDRPDRTLEETLRDVLSKGAEDDGNADVLVLVPDDDSSPSDPAVPINRGLDKLYEDQPDESGDSTLRVLKGVP